MEELKDNYPLEDTEDFNKNKSLLNLISSFKPNDLCVKCANSPLNGGYCNRREHNIKICEQ